MNTCPRCGAHPDKWIEYKADFVPEREPHKLITATSTRCPSCLSVINESHTVTVTRTMRVMTDGGPSINVILQDSWTSQEIDMGD